MGEKLTMENVNFTEDKLDNLCKNAIELIHYSRSVVQREVNLIQVITYFTLGKWIVEVQQDGECRAQYGKKVLIVLSEVLNKQFKKGFSVATLTNIRKFYLTYQSRIPEAVVREFMIRKSQPPVTKLEKESLFQLSWSHYLILMRIENEEERNFYEQQALKEGWGKRELQRQYGSSLYERLLIGKDKEKILATSQKGQIIEKPGDIVKDPYVLEFLGLDEKIDFSETELETRLINHLQEFLLELGTGFAFVARQKRFTFEEDHFRVDLVFYNRLLQCFVLFDLKTEKLRHQDLGQMQMYVNYYDRYEKQDFENPTIGILMCPDKNDAMVELTLPENSNIYASKYQLYLPDKKLLQDKLEEWMEEI